MWTSCAHYRRSYGNFRINYGKFILYTQNFLSNYCLRKLSNVAEKLLANYICNADITAVLFDNAVKLLDYVNLFIFSCKIPYKLYRKRIYHAEFQYGSLVSQSFLCILICCAACNYAEFGIFGNFDSVQRRSFRILNEILSSFFNENVSASCKRRHHNIFCHIFFIFF